MRNWSSWSTLQWRKKSRLSTRSPGIQTTRPHWRSSRIIQSCVPFWSEMWCCLIRSGSRLLSLTMRYCSATANNQLWLLLWCQPTFWIAGKWEILLSIRCVFHAFVILSVDPIKRSWSPSMWRSGIKWEPRGGNVPFTTATSWQFPVTKMLQVQSRCTIGNSKKLTNVSSGEEEGAFAGEGW